MYIVTSLSYDDLGRLIREKKISLNNADLLFGVTSERINRYFQERIGYSGYVVGLRGRLNPTTARVFSSLDAAVRNGSRIMLEAEIDENDMIRYSVSGVNVAAEALAYGLPESDVYEQLDEARSEASDSQAVEVLCVPYIQTKGKIRVTNLTEEIQFNVDGITFVKI